MARRRFASAFLLVKAAMIAAVVHSLVIIANLISTIVSVTSKFIRPTGTPMLIE